jgi:hypothetical protein
LEPTSISVTSEDVIVQTSPAWPVYSEHSFVTWRSPLRGKDAESEATVPAPVVARLDTPGLAVGLTGFTDPSAHPPAASAAAQKHTLTTRRMARLMILSFRIAAGGFEPGLRGICHEPRAVE